MTKIFWVTCPQCKGEFYCHWQELRHKKDQASLPLLQPPVFGRGESEGRRVSVISHIDFRLRIQTAERKDSGWKILMIMNRIFYQ